MSKSKIVVGDTYKVKSGYLKVTEKLDEGKFKVQFTSTGYVAITTGGNIRKGKVKDYLARQVYGKGFLGEPVLKEDKHIRKVWQDLLKRAYSAKFIKKNPAYKEVSVADEWLDFRNFRDFYRDHFRPGLQLDKDLIKPGNKVYGPKYCIYLPPYLNKIIMSVAGDYSDDLGVTKRGDTYVSSIKRNSKVKHLGSFDNKHDAHVLYMKHKIHSLETAIDIYRRGKDSDLKVIKYLNKLVKRLKSKYK